MSLVQTSPLCRALERVWKWKSKIIYQFVNGQAIYNSLLLLNDDFCLFALGILYGNFWMGRENDLFFHFYGHIRRVVWLGGWQRDERKLQRLLFVLQNWHPMALKISMRYTHIGSCANSWVFYGNKETISKYK